MDFVYDGGKPGAGGTATLYVNDRPVGSKRIEQTEFAVFSGDETAGVGVDPETAVSEDYTPVGSKFTGKIDKVTINLKK
jgi:arylsulfatase